MADLKPVTVDFETEAICPRPEYPPKPVGVSIKWPGQKARYFAFGHPTGNNSTLAQAKAELAKAWAHEGGVLFHNSKFDVDVAETHMGMPRLSWDRMHDTMFLVFLQNPHADSHGLKQSAERILGMEPTERDAVREWLIGEGIVTKASKNWGAFIAKAPGDLVGKYADGDVIRTEKLFSKLMVEMKKRKMLEAYDRERKLMPILLDMEREGVHVDTGRLSQDITRYNSDLELMTKWIYKRLQSPKFNLDSGEELIQALVAAGKVSLSLLGTTPTGAFKTDKASLAAAITDPTLAAMLNHRASLLTCVGTFMQPWLETAKRSGGKIFTGWNQLKQYHGTKTAGAVTGRMSSSPNFQNIPKEFRPNWKHEEKDPKKAKLLPKCPLNLSALPLVRSYIIAPPGYVLIDRDYNQQELRILAHYESGDLLESYIADPWMDVHQKVTDTVNGMLGTSFERVVMKSINFGLIYGMGVALMGIKAGCSTEIAGQAKRAVLKLYPGLRELQDGLKELAATDKPLRTWGGRQYYVEPPKVRPDLSVWTFEYKMLNVLVQGSAADCTKEAIIRYDAAKPKRHKLLLQVHDELLACVPEKEVAKGMQIMRVAMESVVFAVPMLSDGKISSTNWADMKAYDKKGELV